MVVEAFTGIGIALSIAGALAPALFKRIKTKSYGRVETPGSDVSKLQADQGTPDKEKTVTHRTIPMETAAPRKVRLSAGGLSPVVWAVLIVVAVAILIILIPRPRHTAINLPFPSQTASVPPGVAPKIITFIFTTTPGLHLLLVVALLSIMMLVRHALMNGFMQLDFAARFLTGFAFLVVLFGLSALITYRHSISVSPDKAYEGIGLFFAMVAGMFVQVLAGNYTRNQKLLSVSGSQLVFPILYSPFVYYPIWGLSSSSPRLSFSLYAAFVNGYFWESVVSAVKSQAKGKTVNGLVMADDPVSNSKS
jgi:hypothetical protein